MKTPMSRFQIHDDLTAPEGWVPVLRVALATGGQLPNFLGVIAGAPALLRAYARFRSELRHGRLKIATLERIALAVADHFRSEPGLALHSRTARAAGLKLDDIALAREWDSRDEREAALLRYLKAVVAEPGAPRRRAQRRPWSPGPGQLRAHGDGARARARRRRAAHVGAALAGPPPGVLHLVDGGWTGGPLAVG